jgi:hypothetical protein
MATRCSRDDLSFEGRALRRVPVTDRWLVVVGSSVGEQLFEGGEGVEAGGVKRSQSRRMMM